MMKKGMSILMISFMLMGAFGVLMTVSERLANGVGENGKTLRKCRNGEFER